MSKELMILPMGRLLMGDCFTANDKDAKGKPLTNKDGTPRVSYFAGVAIPKGAEWDAAWAKIHAVAVAEMPQQHTNPRFSWKLIDGDTALDKNGKPYNTREGYAGHMIVRATSGFAPQTVDENAQVIGADSGKLKRGHYVRMGITVAGNNEVDDPGIYINIQFLQHMFYGEEIKGGVDVAEALAGQAAPAMPAGASTAPVAGSSTPTPAVPNAAPAGNTPPPPQTPSATPPPPVSEPSYIMTAAANGMTREQYHAAKWTDEQMIAQGIMAEAPGAPDHGMVNNA